MRVIFILISSIVIAYYHFTMIDQHTPMHSVHYRLNYIPILAAAVWFGRLGGGLSSALVTLVYLPHVVFGHGHDPFTGANVYLEFILYNLVGWLVGDLVTRRLRDQSRLSESTRLAELGHLAAGIAHEIRNPVQTITGALDILARRHSEDSGDLIGAARDEAGRLNLLVRDFLSLSRPPRLTVVDADLSALARQIVERITIARQNAMPKVEWYVTRDVTARCDPEELGRALRNVLENAIDETGPDGKLRITVEGDAGGAAIIVDDTGPGVAAADREKLFEPFHTKKSGGTGLGLSLARQIVDAHHGTLLVADSPLGGARFVFSLPVSER